MDKINVLVIVGPTASGKTKLSVELAKIFNGEIISADSMQIYKEMNIGTAKPTEEEKSSISHHLLDFLDISKTFSVANYVNLAKKSILEVNAKGKLPIICGGTGLYIDSLINNIDFQKEESDLSLREDLINIYKNDGIEPLLKMLLKIDKESYEKIHRNNVKRIIRAIEIYKTTGITMSDQIKKSKLVKSPYKPIFIGLDFKNRDILYERINKRVDKMMEAGLLDEAKYILSKECSLTAKNAICYKEFIPYFNGTCTLSDSVESLKKSTRRYAKRQLTWFRKNNRINWLFVDEYDSFEYFLKKCTKYVDFSKSI